MFGVESLRVFISVSWGLWGVEVEKLLDGSEGLAWWSVGARDGALGPDTSEALMTADALIVPAEIAAAASSRPDHEAAAVLLREVEIAAARDIPIVAIVCIDSAEPRWDDFRAAWPGAMVHVVEWHAAAVAGVLLGCSTRPSAARPAAEPAPPRSARAPSFDAPP